MKIIISMISLAFSTWLVSCGNHGHQSASQKGDALRNNILGLWGGLNEDSPVWKITADSIYYFQEGKTYPYTLYVDSLVIRFPDHLYSLKHITVIGDTMVFKDEVGKMYAYRFTSKGKGSIPNLLKWNTTCAQQSALRKLGWRNGHSTSVILMIFCNLAVSKQKLRPSERQEF